MRQHLARFLEHISSVEQLGFAFEVLEGQRLSEHLVIDELLRAELALGVSALDTFVHDILRVRACEIFNGGSEIPLRLLSTQVAFSLTVESMDCSTRAQVVCLLDNELRRINGYKTFQTPEQIADALGTIGVQALWADVARFMGKEASEIKMRLKLLVERRNKIVHESDLDPSSGYTLKAPIDLTMVKQSTSFLKAIAESIDQVVFG